MVVLARSDTKSTDSAWAEQQKQQQQQQQAYIRQDSYQSLHQEHVQCQQQPKLQCNKDPAAAATAAVEDDLEVVGLLNAPDRPGIAVLSDAPGGSSDFILVLKQHHAAITIHRHVRGMLVRQHQVPAMKQQACLRKQAAACLQRAFRCHRACKQLTAMRHEQQHQQQHRHQQQLWQAVSSGLKQESVNAAWRGYYQCHGQAAARVIQRRWRAYRARQQYQQQKTAAVVLQACCRGWHVRTITAHALRVRQQERQQKLLQQQSLNQQRQQRKDAALALQCCVRGWLARRLLQQLTVANTEEAAAVRTTGTETAAQHTQVVAGCTVSSAVDDGHQRGSRNRSSSSIVNNAAQMHTSNSSGRSSNECGTDGRPASTSHTNSQQPHKNSNACDGTQYSCRAGRSSSRQPTSGPVAAARACGAVCSELPTRQLVIRSAADMRTAMQHGDGSNSVGAKCVEQLAREIVWRAGELEVEEVQQQVDLSIRTLVAGSSFKKLQEAMVMVKFSRVT